jgi:two-component system repressor protein LuxO
VPIELPPLRLRGEDVVLVARHLLDLYAREEGKVFSGFDAEAEAAIRAYPWPGNVRQLQNVLRNAVVLHDGTLVTREMLPVLLLHEAVAEPVPFTPARPTLEALTTRIEPLAVSEKRLILQALEQTGQDVPRAAALLEINPSTIYRKLTAWKQAG